MPCNVLDNAIKDMYYKGIMSEARMVNPNKITEFNIANEELKKVAQDLYGVKDKGLPFTIVDEGPRKEITGSSYRRDNISNVLRAEPNMPFFKELQSNYDSIENENARLEYEQENKISENIVGTTEEEAIQDFEKLIESGEITQFCSR